MILQSLWFIQANGGTWFLVGGITHDLVADPEGLPAFINQWHVTDRSIENLIAAIAYQSTTLVKRQEWNTPPRVLTVDMQPNVP